MTSRNGNVHGIRDFSKTIFRVAKKCDKQVGFFTDHVKNVKEKCTLMIQRA